MMICRCPGCGTPFRVTPQQIKVRNGLVRCGECKIVFNALDQLVEGQEPRPATPPPLANVAATFGVGADRDDDARDLAAHLAPLQAAHAPKTGDAADTTRSPTPEAPSERRDGTATPAAANPHEAAPAVSREPAEASDDIAAAPSRQGPPASPLAQPLVAGDDERGNAEPSVEETREAALAAGLVAPRELRTAPGYSRWAEKPLTRAGGPQLSGPARSFGWLYALFAAVLLLGLAAQAAHHYRTELATRWPAARPLLERLCAPLGCTVGLPRQADLISIEASDLHSDPQRGGLLVLQATLRNRAPFAQTLPALELTITDTEDRAVARRVLLPADYLAPSSPTGSLPAAFDADSELSVRLWIDARDVGAAGYRLYLFYP